MNPIIKNLTLAAAVFTMTVTLASVVPSFAALAQTTAPSAAASLPATTVKALQEALNKQGIAVKADGVFDDDTRTAIRRYQSLHHLPVTGEPDKATLDKLGVAGQRSDLPTGSPAAGAVMPRQAMGGAGAGGQGMMGMMGGMQGRGMMMDDMKSMGGGQAGSMGSGGSGPMQGGSGSTSPASPSANQGGAGAPITAQGSGAAQPHPVSPIMSVFGDPDRIKGRIAFLRAELGITEAQSAAWIQFADALMRSRTHLLEAHAALQDSAAGSSSARRLESYERHLAARLESLKSARAGFVQLSAVLDERQKQEAEELLIPFLATF